MCGIRLHRLKCQRQYIIFLLIFISSCHVFISVIQLCKISDHKNLTLTLQRSPLKFICFLPSGREHNAVFPKKQGLSSWIFPLFWRLAFSCLCIFPSVFKMQLSMLSLLLHLPWLAPPKLSQQIYKKVLESRSSCGRMLHPIHTLLEFSTGSCSVLQGMSSLVGMDQNDVQGFGTIDETPVDIIPAQAFAIRLKLQVSVCKCTGACHANSFKNII